MASGEDIVRFAGEIHRNSNRLLTLIDDVIRLSELDASEREEEFGMIDLGEIAETCVNMLKNTGWISGLKERAVLFIRKNG